MPDVATALFAPLTWDPDGAGMGWPTVGAGDPDITVAVPAMIAGNPDVAGVRRSWNDFNRARWRWADADDDLCICGPDGDKETGRGDKKMAP